MTTPRPPRTPKDKNAHRPYPHGIPLSKGDTIPSNANNDTCPITGEIIPAGHAVFNTSSVTKGNPHKYDVCALAKWIITCQQKGWNVTFPLSRQTIPDKTKEEIMAKARLLGCTLPNTLVIPSNSNTNGSNNSSTNGSNNSNSARYYLRLSPRNPVRIEWRDGELHNLTDALIESPDADYDVPDEIATTTFWEGYYNTLKERLRQTPPDNVEMIANILYRIIDADMTDISYGALAEMYGVSSQEMEDQFKQAFYRVLEILRSRQEFLRSRQEILRSRHSEYKLSYWYIQASLSDLPDVVDAIATTTSKARVASLLYEILSNIYSTCDTLDALKKLPLIKNVRFVCRLVERVFDNILEAVYKRLLEESVNEREAWVDEYYLQKWYDDGEDRDKLITDILTPIMIAYHNLGIVWVDIIKQPYIDALRSKFVSLRLTYPSSNTSNAARTLRKTHAEFFNTYLSLASGKALERIHSSRSGGSSIQYVTYKKRSYKIQIGKRGGKYILVQGNKLYV